MSTTTVNPVALGLPRRGREVGTDPPAWLPDAMKPDAGLGAHPRRDDGDGRRLPARARQPDLQAAPDVQHLAAILGAITLLVAGVALVQWDIKRVIAY
jgi:hypothetical protein